MATRGRILALVIAAVAIPTVIALPLVWFNAYELKSKLTLTLAILAGSGGFALAIRSRVNAPAADARKPHRLAPKTRLRDPRSLRPPLPL